MVSSGTSQAHSEQHIPVRRIPLSLGSGNKPGFTAAQLRSASLRLMLRPTGSPAGAGPAREGTGEMMGLDCPEGSSWARCGYLDVAVQQLLGEALQRGSLVLGEASTAVQERDLSCVPCCHLGVEVLEGFEVIVDGMAHHHLPCQQLQDLGMETELREGRCQQLGFPWGTLNAPGVTII